MAVSLKEIQEASKSDNEILKIKEGLLNGIWNESIKRYRVFEVEFCFCDNILLRGNRIVIPTKLRQRVLGAAHEGHPGIVAINGTLRKKSGGEELINRQKNL